MIFRIIITIYFVTLVNITLSEEIPIIVISPGKTFQSKGIVGSDISVISEGSINNSSEFFINDIISNNVTGTHLSRQGGVGTNTLFQVRGLPKRYTNVYIDGVKMSDPSTPDNSFYFNNLTSNGVQQIEVLKGNQSSLYGSGAIGGAINIYTKTSKSSELNRNINVFTGENNTKNLLISFDQQLDEFDYFLGLNRYLTDGISAMTHNSEDDSYRNDNVILNIGYRINENLKIENKFRASKSLLNYDSTNKNLTDINDRSNDKEFSYVFRILDEKEYIKNSYTYNRYYVKRNVQDNTTARSNYYGYRDSLNYNGEYNFNLDNKIVFGLDNEFEAADFDTWATSSAFKSDEAIFSQFFDLQLRPLEKFYTTLGARRDSHTTAGDYTTYRFTGAYKPDNSTKFRSSIGTGIRFATLNDYFYDTNVIVKENLKPEKSYSIDFGLEKSLLQNRLNFGSNIFYMEYDDTISNWQSHKASGSSWTIENSSGKVKSKGLEFFGSLETSLIDKITLGYALTDAHDGEDCDDPDGSCIDEMPVRVPRHSINTNFSKKFGLLATNLKGRFQSETRDYGNINNGFAEVILGSYTQIDFSANANYNGYNIFFDLNNIFDENYEQAYQYSVPGREFNIGLKRNF